MYAVELSTIICDFEETVDETILYHGAEISVHLKSSVVYFSCILSFVLLLLTVRILIFGFTLTDE